MGQKIVWLLLILLFSNCSEIVQEKTPIKEATAGRTVATEAVIPAEPLVETPSAKDLAQHLAKYKTLKARIKRQAAQVANNNEGRELLSNMMMDSIFSYWYGTGWDFNGHTTKPLDGDIACGYFITTTLKDAGIKLNRIKLAQQASSVIIKKLCKAESIKTFSKLSSLKNYLRSVADNEILILGLEYHVGFVMKREGKTYFIHSNYMDRKGVEKEILEESLAIPGSSIYMIGNVSTNDALIKEWWKG